MQRRRGQSAVSIVAMVLAVAALAFGAHAESFDASMTRVQIQQRFAALRASRALNVDAPLRWEYRFSDPDVRKLEALSIALVTAGYLIETIAPPVGGIVELRVAKVEQHTPASLDRRNVELRGLAFDYAVRSYDGVDAAANTPPRAR